MNDEQVLAIATILWNNYSQHDRNYHAAKNEVNDGSKDWEAFHYTRVTNALFQKEYAFGLSQAFKEAGRRVPKVGARVDACCPTSSIKIVARVDHNNDSIEYTDGTSDSIWHCGWRVVTDTNEV